MSEFLKWLEINDEIYFCWGNFGVNVEGWLMCISGSFFLGEIKRECWKINLGGGLLYLRSMKIFIVLEFLFFSVCIIIWMYFCKGKLLVL